MNDKIESMKKDFLNPAKPETKEINNVGIGSLFATFYVDGLTAENIGEPVTLVGNNQVASTRNLGDSIIGQLMHISEDGTQAVVKIRGIVRFPFRQNSVTLICWPCIGNEVVGDGHGGVMRGYHNSNITLAVYDDSCDVLL